MSSEREQDHEDLARLAILLEGPGAESYRLMVSRWRIAAEAKGREARLKKWAEATGLPLSEVRRLSVPLLLSGICREDGTTDPDALAVVATALASALERLEGGRKPSGKGKG